jgi:hypothetical protein
MTVISIGHAYLLNATQVDLLNCVCHAIISEVHRADLCPSGWKVNVKHTFKVNALVRLVVPRIYKNLCIRTCLFEINHWLQWYSAHRLKYVS